MRYLDFCKSRCVAPFFLACWQNQHVKVVFLELSKLFIGSKSTIFKNGSLFQYVFQKVDNSKLLNTLMVEWNVFFFLEDANMLLYPMFENTNHLLILFLCVCVEDTQRIALQVFVWC